MNRFLDWHNSYHIIREISSLRESFQLKMIDVYICTNGLLSLTISMIFPKTSEYGMWGGTTPLSFHEGFTWVKLSWLTFWIFTCIFTCRGCASLQKLGKFGKLSYIQLRLCVRPEPTTCDIVRPNRSGPIFNAFQCNTLPNKSKKELKICLYFIKFVLRTVFLFLTSSASLVIRFLVL